MLAVRTSLCVALLGGSSAVCTGCGSSPAPPPEMRFALAPDDALNDAQPCYVVIRNVDTKTYLEESYQTVAAQVMAPDASVLKTLVVFPGKPQSVSVSPPAKGEIAIYAFFYEPEGDWKALLPSSAASFDILLEGSRLTVSRR